MSTEMFRDPAQPGMFKPAEWDRHLLLIEPRRFLENIPTSNGPADAVEATVHILSAQPQVEVIEQARLFGAFSNATRDSIGSSIPVLGRISQFVSRAGGPAYKLDAASPEDKQAAAGYWQQWQAQHATQAPAVKQTGPALMGYDAPPAAPAYSPQPQPQGYGAPSEQDRQWNTQAQYVGQGTTTNVAAPAPVQPAAPPAPAAPAPAASAPVPQPQPTAQAGPAPVQALTEEQIAQLPPEFQAQMRQQQGQS